MFTHQSQLAALCATLVLLMPHCLTEIVQANSMGWSDGILIVYYIIGAINSFGISNPLHMWFWIENFQMLCANTIEPFRLAEKPLMHPVPAPVVIKINWPRLRTYLLNMRKYYNNVCHCGAGGHGNRLACEISRISLSATCWKVKLVYSLAECLPRLICIRQWSGSKFGIEIGWPGSWHIS